MPVSSAILSTFGYEQPIMAQVPQDHQPAQQIAENGPLRGIKPEALRFTTIRVLRGLETDLAPVVGLNRAGAIAQVVKRVLVWWVNPRRDFRKGDRLSFIWNEQPHAEPIVFAIWLRSKKLKGEKKAVFHWPLNKVFRRWVEPDTGYEVAKRLRNAPLKSYEQITALVNDGRGHKGIDFKAPKGTPVFSPFDGKILQVNWSTRYNGRCIRIVNEKTGWEGVFLHLSSVSKQLKPGSTIKRGQVLGRVGNTGRSFAPHLHYQLEKNGRILNPFRIQRTWRARLSTAEQQRAKAMLEALSHYRGGRD